MNIFFWLVLHIAGLTTMAGTALVSYVAYSHFWKQYALVKERGVAILSLTASFRFLFAAGFLLLLVSGIGLLALSHGLFAEQLWFRIKMGLFLLVLLNGAVYGQRLSKQLRKLVDQERAGADAHARRETLKSRLLVMHIVQLLLFAGIFVLSVYKFN